MTSGNSILTMDVRALRTPVGDEVTSLQSTRNTKPGTRKLVRDSSRRLLPPRVVGTRCCTSSPKSCPTVPESYPVSPESCRTVPTRFPDVPKPYPSVSARYPSVPKGYLSVPKLCSGVLEPYPTVPERYLSLPEAWSDAPEAPKWHKGRAWCLTAPLPEQTNPKTGALKQTRPTQPPSARP